MRVNHKETGAGIRRQATNETSSREVGFCVEKPTRSGRANRKPEPSVQDIGARLALTRRALILTRFQMARLIGIDVPTWGTYEAGLERIPPDEALKLSPYGISLIGFTGAGRRTCIRTSAQKFGNCSASR